MAQTNTKFAEYLDGPDDNWSAKVIDCVGNCIKDETSAT